MTIKLAKSEAVEKISSLLALGLSYRVIGQRIGLSAASVCRYVKEFGLMKRCLHCGVDIPCHPCENSCGPLRPTES